MSDPKTLTLTTDSSKRREKAQKEYVPDDPESEPSSSDLSQSPFDLSDDSKYENRIHNKKKIFGSSGNRTCQTHC